jgi:hypothetical protein
MYKKITLVLCAALLHFYGHSQSTPASVDSNKYKAFLFDRFHDGYVLMKSGDLEKAPLNYNTDDQNIYFIEGGQFMILSGLESVDTIYFQNKKFVPVRGVVYEVLTDESSSAVVFVSYTNKERSVTVTADHNGTGKQTANQVSNTVTGAYANGISNKNRLLEIEKHYWFQKSKKMYKADNVKQVTRIFPSKSNEIEKFIADNNINFVLDADLVKLSQFCQGKD